MLEYISENFSVVFPLFLVVLQGVVVFLGVRFGQRVLDSEWYCVVGSLCCLLIVVYCLLG